jgi:predicted lipoprotein with Yx(FWY)xxD motif
MRRVIGLAGLVLAAAACSSGGHGSLGSAAVSAPAGSTITEAASSLGQILVDSRGFTLYTFSADTPGHFACTATCLQHWPAVLARTGFTSSITAVATVRSPEGLQVTWQGHPLYTFTGDTSPGQTNGQGRQGFGGAWSVAVVSGVGGATPSSRSGPPTSARNSAQGSPQPTVPHPAAQPVSPMTTGHPVVPQPPAPRPTTPVPSTAPAPTSPPRTAPPTTAGTTTTQCIIPQGNGGDHDADNNGGPDDGDGCDV